MKKLAKAMYGKSMMKNGGTSKMKKYAEGGKSELGPVYSQPTGGKGGVGTYDPSATTKTPTTGKKSYKTGGMVNSNTKVSALKIAGSKGTKSGVNSKVSASKKAKGRPAKSMSPKKANP